MNHQPLNDTLANPPTREEVTKAIKHLSSSKTLGADSIPAKIYASGGSKLNETLMGLFTSIWTQEKLSQELKHVSIIDLYLCKGNKNACGNQHSFSLLTIAGKVLACILFNHLKAYLESDLLLESQCGFHMGCSTADMVFTTQHLQEMYCSRMSNCIHHLCGSDKGI